jgi:putative transposase
MEMYCMEVGMARSARVIAPRYPHHITQRGNRRQKTFFCEEDFKLYKNLMAHWCKRFNVEVWAYCLMPNHIHLIAVPSDADSFHKVIGEAHRRYTRHINFRENWRGHLWQGRFASYVMDDNYLVAAARYIELNPVRAHLVNDPSRYPWSSASSHLKNQDDDLVMVKPLLQKIPDWSSFLKEGMEKETVHLIRKHENTGRPLGNEVFMTTLENELGKKLSPLKAGRPKKKN